MAFHRQCSRLAFWISWEPISKPRRRCGNRAVIVTKSIYTKILAMSADLSVKSLMLAIVPESSRIHRSGASGLGLPRRSVLVGLTRPPLGRTQNTNTGQLGSSLPASGHRPAVAGGERTLKFKLRCPEVPGSALRFLRDASYGLAADRKPPGCCPWKMDREKKSRHGQETVKFFLISVLLND